jgi:hypothetical protein
MEEGEGEGGQVGPMSSLPVKVQLAITFTLLFQIASITLAAVAIIGLLGLAGTCVR